MDLVKPTKAILAATSHGSEAGSASVSEGVLKSNAVGALVKQVWSRPKLEEASIDAPELFGVVSMQHLLPVHDYPRTATSSVTMHHGESRGIQHKRAAYMIGMFRHEETSPMMRREGQESIVEFGFGHSNRGLLPNLSSISVPIGSDLEKAYSRTRGAIVRITDPDENTTGSGAIISDRWIATVRHNSDYLLRPLNLYLSDGRKIQGRFIVLDHRNDLALIETADRLQGLPQLKLGSSAGIQDGIGLQLMGHPAGSHDAAISWGEYLGHHHQNANLKIETSVPAWDGYSGGPYLLNGEMIGTLRRWLFSSENARLTPGLGGSEGKPVEYTKALVAAAQDGVPKKGYISIETREKLSKAAGGYRFNVKVTDAFNVTS